MQARFIKVLFLAIVLVGNVVGSTMLSAGMLATDTMASDKVMMDKQPCHEQMAKGSCCDHDCSSCLSGSVLISIVFYPPGYQPVQFSHSLEESRYLPFYPDSPYRPPITA